MSDETLELLWSMLTNEQLLELREKGAMDERTMASFKTELFKRCLIQFDETADAVSYTHLDVYKRQVCDCNTYG